MNNIELIKNNEINNEIDLQNNTLNVDKQKNFLESTLGKTINSAVDIGIRALLPDFIDEQIINIKNNLMNYGLKEGITKTIDDAIDLGKSAMGIVTGDFENISQMQNAVKNGGIIDGISSLLDTAINKAKAAGVIDEMVANTIKQGKNVILNNVENNIEKKFTDQIKSAEFTNKYINNWKEYFTNKDFDGMQKEYYKINKEIKNLAPIEKTINEANIVKNLHNLIKNNGKNFNLSSEELELAEKLK